MKNGFRDEDAKDAIATWGEDFGEDVALRVYTARLIGRDPSLVLHGGGNVSVKTVQHTLLGDKPAIRVKGSGWNLADIAPEGLPAVDLDYLRQLRALTELTDQEMTNEVRTHLFDATAPTPSIETLVHAFLPHKYVDHSHADAVLVLSNQPDGEKLIKEALGDRVAILPYIYPGFPLAQAVADLIEKNPEVSGIVLLHHGLFTFGDDARTSYERHVSLVTACEEFAAKRCGAGSEKAAPSSGPRPEELASRVGPFLRGLLAVETSDADETRLPILEWRATEEILDFVNSPDAASLCASGPVTTDHLIRTGRVPAFVSNPDWSEEDSWKPQLRECVDSFRTDYESYIKEEASRPEVSGEVRGAALSSNVSPRVVLLPGAGLFCFGATKQDACIAADVMEQTIGIKTKATALGKYESLSRDHLFDMEFRSLQLSKLKANREQPLFGKVVIISGGAGAIGAAIALTCARAGGHVVVTDVSKERLALVVARVASECGESRIRSLVMDVTNQDSVRAGFETLCREYGGVDVVVPNAGIAHVAPVEDLLLEDFNRVLNVNLVGYLLFIQEGVKILKAQGKGGNIVIQASKNVFGPGKDFGAYSASKAAGHQLGKVAAIELAPHGIRVNMINADAVFGDPTIPSGLWQEVGPGRARSRGMKEQDLPEYYRDRNLLKVRVYGHHVGNAVVFFASNQTPTTGATIPVDGGVVEAFPR